MSLWEIKNENQIFNCRFIKDLSIYFPTEWPKSRFLVKVLCYNHPRLFAAESDKREVCSKSYRSKLSNILSFSGISHTGLCTLYKNYRAILRLYCLETAPLVKLIGKPLRRFGIRSRSRMKSRIDRLPQSCSMNVSCCFDFPIARSLQHGICVCIAVFL